MQTERVDAVVLGTGIAGLSAAVALAERGRTVVILGKKEVDGEASPRAAGILDPFAHLEPGHPLLPLSLQAFKNYASFLRRLEKKTRMKVHYAKTGSLCLAMNSFQKRALRANLQWQKKAAIPLFWKDRQALLRAEPFLAPRVRGALYYPTVGRLQPGRLMKAMKKWAQLQGLSVRNIKEAPSLVLRRGKTAGIIAGNKFYKAPVVVSAVGAWAKNIGPNFPSLPVKPIKGQILILERKNVRIHSMIQSYEGAYIIPWDKDSYLLGSTVEKAGFNARVTAGGIAAIRRETQNLVPALRPLKIKESWAGLRPCVQDKLPVIGESAVRGLYLLNGFYRCGILIGFESGSLLAEAILSGRAPAILKSFSPERLGT